MFSKYFWRLIKVWLDLFFALVPSFDRQKQKQISKKSQNVQESQTKKRCLAVK